MGLIKRKKVVKLSNISKFYRFVSGPKFSKLIFHQIFDFTTFFYQENLNKKLRGWSYVTLLCNTQAIVPQNFTILLRILNPPLSLSHFLCPFSLLFTQKNFATPRPPPSKKPAVFFHSLFFSCSNFFSSKKKSFNFEL